VRGSTAPRFKGIQAARDRSGDLEPGSHAFAGRTNLHGGDGVWWKGGSLPGEAGM